MMRASLLNQAVERGLQRIDFIDWHDHRAVAIRVNEIAAVRIHAVHAHRNAELLDMHIGVRRCDRAGQHLEAFGDLRDVADRAVGDGAEAAERLVHVGLHLAPERAVARRLVLVLDHHDARLRQRCDIVEIVESLLHIARSADLVAGADRHRLGEADHRRQVRKRTAQMHGGVAGAAALRRDDLDQVADGRRIDRAQKCELLVRQHRLSDNTVPPFGR